MIFLLIFFVRHFLNFLTFTFKILSKERDPKDNEDNTIFTVLKKENKGEKNESH